MILVLSTYRTGGTNLCKKLAEDNQYENLDEAFHEASPVDHKTVLRYIATKPRQSPLITSKWPKIIKVFPYHISQTSIKNLLTKLVDLSTQIIVLVRKDFDQQCQSYYICKQTNNWHDNFEQPVDITLNKDRWQWCVNFLHNQYLELSELRQTLPEHKLMFTHQLEQGQKYKRPVNWDRAPGFTNIDIEELFLE